jgi:hypothetical protein
MGKDGGGHVGNNTEWMDATQAFLSNSELEPA